MASRRKVWINVVGLGVLAVVVLVLARPGERSSGPPAGGPGAVPTSSSESISEDSKAGAVAAALRFLRMTEEAPRLGPARAGEAQRSVSSSRSADRLGEQVSETLAELLVAYPSLRIHVAPLAWRATATEAGGCQVEVWYAEALLLGEVVLDDWRTVTYSLVWEHGGWRIDDVASVRGPLPERSAAVVASTPSQFTAALAGFEPVR